VTAPATATVVVLGDVATDVVVQLRGDPVRGSDVDAMIRQVGGGAGGNVAVWLATAGAGVRLVGRAGADPVGSQRLDELRAHGVDVRIAIDPLLPTGTIVAVTTPDGERTMYADRGANLALEPADIPEAVLADALHLHVSAYALLHPRPRPAALAALERARELGLTTSTDLSSVAPLAEAGTTAFLAWTRDVDIVRGNCAEAELLTGASDARTACRRLAESYRIAVVTDGAAGAWCTVGDVTVHTEAVPVEVVDTVGAGDAFTAGLLHGLVSGRRWESGSAPDVALLEEAGARGASLAAVAVAASGARPSPRG
jgi:ribokinase